MGSTLEANASAPARFAANALTAASAVRGCFVSLAFLLLTTASSTAVTSGAGADTGLPAMCRLIDQAAVANRLPPAFLARVIWQESRFRNEATSPAGATGVAQFMPHTAAERGLLNPREPVQAITEAARMLMQLTVRFGNLGLGAAAYNAGAARITKWLRAQGDLPPETRLYVRLVTGRQLEEWVPPAIQEREPNKTDGAAACLETVTKMARTAPGKIVPSRRVTLLDDGLGRALDNVLARALRASEPTIHLDAAKGLCDSIRALGARCVVYGQ